jgi:hypothetical protein
MFDVRRTQGDGTVTFFADNQAARLESQVTSPGVNRAILDYLMPQVPGLTVTWSYAARIADLPDPAPLARPFAAIDAAPGGLVERWDYTEEWREYRGSYTVPYTASPGNVFLVLGVFTNQKGILEVTRPRITVSDDAALLSRVVAFDGAQDTGELIAANTGVLDWRRYDFVSVYVADSTDDRLSRSVPLYADLNAWKLPNGTFKDGYIQHNATVGSTTTVAVKRNIEFKSDGSVAIGTSTIGTGYVKQVIFYRQPFVNIV